MDELPYSRNRRGVRKCVGGKFCHSKFFAALTAASNKRFEFVTEKRTRNAGVPIAYAASVSPSLRIASILRLRWFGNELSGPD
jgi:hypothetical protein